MDQEAFNRAKLLLIVKFLHELQHRATRIFSTMKPVQNQPWRLMSQAKILLPRIGCDTPPKGVGGIKVGGVARGDV